MKLALNTEWKINLEPYKCLHVKGSKGVPRTGRKGCIVSFPVSIRSFACRNAVFADENVYKLNRQQQSEFRERWHVLAGWPM